MINPNPADWTYLNSYYIGSNEGISDMMCEDTHDCEKLLTAHGRHSEAKSFARFENEPLTGKCDHCGAHHKWGSVYQHVTLKTCVAVGQDCSANIFRHSDIAAMKRAKIEKKIAAMHANWNRMVRGFRVLVKLIRQHPGMRDWLKSNNLFAKSIRSAATTYGGLTANQELAAIKAASRPIMKKKDLPAWTLPVAGVVVPVGRVEVTGIVEGVWTKRDGPFGDSHKMRVFTDAGFVIIGSRPSGVARGDRIHMKVTLKPSNTPGIAWGSRPHVPSHPIMATI